MRFSFSEERNRYIILFGLKRIPTAIAEDQAGRLWIGTSWNGYGLTAREQEILRLVLQGASNKDIERKLFISASTVRNHIYSIYQKLGVKSRLELINRISKDAQRKPPIPRGRARGDLHSRQGRAEKGSAGTALRKVWLARGMASDGRMSYS